ncbi:MAG: STAS domain-containing protein [Catalinimonas sp.]
MELFVTTEAQHSVIEVIGDLDASSSIMLDQAIEKVVSDGAKSILIDCRALTYISSAGLGVFMSYLKDFEERGINLVLFGVQDKVRGVFEILGLDELIHITQTKEEAKLLTDASTP